MFFPALLSAPFFTPFLPNPCTRQSSLCDKPTGLERHLWTTVTWCITPLQNLFPGDASGLRPILEVGVYATGKQEGKKHAAGLTAVDCCTYAPLEQKRWEGTDLVAVGGKWTGRGVERLADLERTKKTVERCRPNQDHVLFPAATTSPPRDGLTAAYVQRD